MRRQDIGKKVNQYYKQSDKLENEIKKLTKTLNIITNQFYALEEKQKDLIYNITIKPSTKDISKLKETKKKIESLNVKAKILNKKIEKKADKSDRLSNQAFDWQNRYGI